MAGATRIFGKVKNGWSACSFFTRLMSSAVEVDYCGDHEEGDCPSQYKNLSQFSLHEFRSNALYGCYACSTCLATDGFS